MKMIGNNWLMKTTMCDEYDYNDYQNAVDNGGYNADNDKTDDDYDASLLC